MSELNTGAEVSNFHNFDVDHTIDASIFPALTITTLLVSLSEAVSVETYMTIKSLCMVVGWLALLIPARAYSPIYNFISAFKYIVIKDMVPFVLFFVIISIAFGAAIQVSFPIFFPPAALNIFTY